MATGKLRDVGKERFWRRMIQQWRRSGLSGRAFCLTHGLSESSFYAWRRTLAQRDAEPVHFVPVTVVPQEKVGAGGASSDGGLELVLDGGRVLRIGPAFDAATLRRVLALLDEEGQP
jgi:transposase-like protein